MISRIVIPMVGDLIAFWRVRVMVSSTIYPVDKPLAYSLGRSRWTLRPPVLISLLTWFLFLTSPAQSGENGLARELAPTGKLRVAVLMVSYLAVEDEAAGQPKGIIPDLGKE